MEAIRAFSELLAQLPLNKQLEILIARNAEGVPAIQIAAGNEEWEAVGKYGTTLKKLLPLS